MTKFILKRLLIIIPVLWIVATLTFFVMRMTPGGPFDTDRKVPEEILKNLEAKYHLDEPLAAQYLRYMGMLLQGDLGPSFRYPSRTVNEIIAETFPVSALIGLLGLIYALILGVGAGIFAASKPNTKRDFLPMTFAMLGISLPSFVIGPLFMLVFAINLEWFNVAGWTEAKDAVLPALTLGTMYAAYFARLSRAGILDMVHQDFIRTAKAKGLPGWLIMLRHTLKGGLLSTVSFLGPAVAAMLTGSLVVETIFSVPGLGRFFVQSALNRDYTLVLGCVLFLAVFIVLMNLIVDIAYAFMNPKVSYDSNGT
ncbi:MAG: ABC transporter permease subunit [Deltaproteobacteria bacterium]|nr:ABC transporter permease subunit [Deltaproteobacteria bacterium]